MRIEAQVHDRESGNILYTKNFQDCEKAMTFKMEHDDDEITISFKLVYEESYYNEY